MNKIGYIVLMIALSLSSYVSAHENLIGKTFTHSWTTNTFPEAWPTPKYETRFCDASTLVWNNVTDLNNVSSGVEHYSAVEIIPGIVQVSWKESPESTNYGIVWTLKFDTNDIFGVLVNIDPKTNFVVSGKFKSVGGLGAEKPLKGCP